MEPALTSISLLGEIKAEGDQDWAAALLILPPMRPVDPAYCAIFIHFVSNLLNGILKTKCGGIVSLSRPTCPATLPHLQWGPFAHSQFCPAHLALACHCLQPPHPTSIVACSPAVTSSLPPCLWGLFSHSHHWFVHHHLQPSTPAHLPSCLAHLPHLQWGLFTPSQIHPARLTFTKAHYTTASFSCLASSPMRPVGP